MNLNQVTIPSENVGRSAKFYELLGLKMIVDALPRYARFECPDGDSTFSIHHEEGFSAGGAIVYFECHDLDDRVADLQAKGVMFDHGPVDQEWLWREASLKDPDGHRVILYWAGANRLYPPWRIKK